MSSVSRTLATLLAAAVLAALWTLVAFLSPSAAAAQTPTGQVPTSNTATTATPPGPNLAALQAELQRMVDGYWNPGQYAVAVTDLQTGGQVSVYGDRWQLSACSINLLVLLQATLDMQAGRLKQADVEPVVKSVIWSSNATAARDLYAMVGGGDVVAGLERVDALVARLGLTRTILDHPPAFTQWSLDKHPSNWLTADDANRIMTAIWSDDLLTTAWRDWLLDRLTEVKPGLNYLTAVTPAARVSHKNGFFPAIGGGYVDNDVALVRFTAGGREYAYALSFFSQAVAVEYADITLGQQVTHRTYEYFRAAYGW